jgi:hypothetical protein
MKKEHPALSFLNDPRRNDEKSRDGNTKLIKTKYNISMNINFRKALKIIFVICSTIFLVLALLGYLYYRDLKKSFVQTLSSKSTAFIGQPVEIGDLSISPSSGINLYDISIRNPEGFPSGNLLRIKRVYLDTKYNELFSGRFSGKNITVYAPELTLLRDGNGRFNISDKLMQFFQKKSTLTYQVDTFDLNSGSIDFNNDKRFKNENIAIHLKNLSSSPGTKTMIKGNTTYAGGQITIDGWVALKAEPKKYIVSVSSGEIPLAAFRDVFNRYKIETEKTKIKVNAVMEGDSESGLNVTSDLRINNIGAEFIRKDTVDITFKTKASLNLRENSLLIEDVSVDSTGVISAKLKAFVKNIGKHPVYNAELILNRLDLSAFNISQDFTVKGTMTSNKMCINSVVNKTLPAFSGSVAAKKIFITGKDKRNVLKDAVLNARVRSDAKDMNFDSDMQAGKISVKATGTAKDILDGKRSIKVSVKIPDVQLTSIRETFWDIVPDRLLYAGLDGSLSCRLSMDYRENDRKVSGDVVMKNIVLQGENGEYSVGPINGTLPLAYSSPVTKESRARKFPMFERSQFNKLRTIYSQGLNEGAYSKITIGSLGYGFRLFSGINLWLRQEGTVLNIERFNGNIFGGRMNGSGYIDMSDGIQYRAGFILEDLSLTNLCDGIEPIKGYISGKVDGVANVKGAGKGFADLIGKADFWSFSTDKEKTKISKEFLRKIGGPSLKTYLGDRSFDKGIVSMYMRNGYILFNELEISNRNFLGITDLSVKVAPFNNRITIDHLLWTITEAAQRAKNK